MYNSSISEMLNATENSLTAWRQFGGQPFSTDTRFTGSLRTFRVEQRAIGEIVHRRVKHGGTI